MTDIEVRRHAWPDLFTVPGGPRTRISAAVAKRLFSGVVGRFGIRVVVAPDWIPTQGPVAEVPTIVLVRPDEFYARIGRDGLIGFGESYMTGAWDSPDLAQLLTTLAGEIGTLVPGSWQRLRKWYVARHPVAHRNSEDNTRSNISHHYDLSNELFAAFLDESLTYSAALFEGSADPRGASAATLPDAQARKIDRLLDVTKVGPGTRVLEIGTGWGELAIRAAQRGAIVHSVTLSSEQRALAQARVLDAGCADSVTIDLLDYRAVTGVYDAVVSVEMIEAVGHEFLPAYFQTIRDRLAPGGLAGIQAIVMPHERMLETLGTFTWIHKYIFPGGFLPSPDLLTQVSLEAGLETTSEFSFGRHYAETLRLWDERFLSVDVAALGFDETFRRMWHFYLTYSRAGFDSGYLDVQQWGFRRES
jgi:cyclopropane-fatty-acyl-phospholipid synthase